MKRPSNLSESLHRQLNSYALAASAAGVSLVAAAQPAEAKIIYTRTHHLIDHRHPRYLLDLSHDRTADFVIAMNTSRSRSQGRSWLSVGPLAMGNAADIVKKHYSTYSIHTLALALNRGAKIGSSNFRYGDIDGIMLSIGLGCSSRTQRCQVGYWSNVTNRYLGLKFVIKGKPHFAWARLNVQATGGIPATLTGYAYETIPNKPIIAGRTHGNDVITVQPATLGHLARGASAIPVWRGNKQ